MSATPQGNTASRRRSRYVPFVGWAYEMWSDSLQKWMFVGWTSRPVA